MNLLEFARGPAFQFSLIVFVFGVVWRLTGTFLMYRRRDLSRPRRDRLVPAGFRSILMRSVPDHELEKRIVFQHVSGYAWHIAFFVSLLLFGPHLPFFQQFLGFTRPVMRLLSKPDDYISIVLTMLPLITGFMAYARVMPFGMRYETILALHLLSFCALLVWFPFGKLMHLFLAFPSRFQAGALLRRKGVEA